MPIQILIVDDDQILLDALSALLQIRLPDVSVETCPSAAVALARIAETDYDAIISDIKMPGMDGLAFMAKVQKIRPTTPTLLITGHGDHDLGVKALSAGAYAFIQKPIDRDYFIAWLKRAIQLRELSKQVEQNNRMLERTVHERTVELERANQDLKAALEQERRSEARFRSCFELGLIGMAITSPTKGILEINDEICKMLGHERDELLRMTWAELTYPDDLAADIAQFNRVLAGEIDGYSLDKRWIRKDGHVIDSTISVKCLRRADGSVDYFVALIQDITERKRAEEALNASNAKLRETSALLNMLLRKAPIGFAFFDDQLRYRVINESLAETNGIPAEAHLGKTVGDIVPDLEDAARKVFQLVMRTGQPILDHEFIGEMPKQPGVIRSWNESWYPITTTDGTFLGVGAIVQETTEAKRHQQVLRESEERYRLVAKATNDAIWDWDLTTNAVRWNDAVESLFGWSEAVAGTSAEWWKERIHPEDQQRVVQGIEAVITDPVQQHWQDEYRFRRADGGYADVLDRGYVLREPGGRAIRMIGAILDVTDRKRSQAQLVRWNTELERHVLERTQELIRSQERLRALATELSLAEQRERRRLATELHDYLAQLLALGRLKLGQARQGIQDAKAAERLKETDELVNQSLTYIRTLVAELSPPMLQEFGLPVALKWLAERMQRHELHVEVQIEQEHLPLPEEQAVLLFQSVRELLMNVVKHARTSRATISLGTTSDGDVRLTVSDAGCGLEPAVNGHGTQQPSQFGLFSIRERMEALGGRFELESTPGQGTRATLVLTSVATRSAPAAAHAPPTPTQSSSVPQRTRAGPVRVLLVDDHTLVRQGVRSLLDAHPQVQVIGEASDGQEAIALARALKPEIILMDINMPKMDGIEATRRIKQEQPETIVIGLSVHNSGTLEAAMRAAGAEAFASKDEAAERLAETIQIAVARKVDPTKNSHAFPLTDRGPEHA